MISNHPARERWMQYRYEKISSCWWFFFKHLPGMFTVKEKCWVGHCFVLGACTLTLLMLLPERKYGRWPNTGGLTTDGHNEKAHCQSHYTSLWKNTHTNQPLPVCQGSRLQSEPSGRFSPFSSAFLFFFQAVKRLRFDMLSLISCLFSRWQAGSRDAVELMQTKQGGNFKASKESPLSRKAIIRN